MVQKKSNHPLNKLIDGMLGHAVGDALGVPHEFKERSRFRDHPVTGMDGFDTHNQPPGTWSDDTSLSLCLAESLLNGIDLEDQAAKFIAWREEGYWTAGGSVFDIGGATNVAITKLMDGVDPIVAGGKSEYGNGNGSLMRILPLLAVTNGMNSIERMAVCSEVGSVTHGHPRSIIACYLYLVFCEHLLITGSKEQSYQECKICFYELVNGFEGHYRKESAHFLQLFEIPVNLKKEREIESGGYVVHTLMASIWCLMTTDNFQDAVLKAVNLGGDTDTTAAVTGGMAGILYGEVDIPKAWLAVLKRKEAIVKLGQKLVFKYQK